ncbi:MAG: flagellar assembly protein FliW [Bacillota bacterium]|jgi:flagellar assembly factor FliW
MLITFPKGLPGFEDYRRFELQEEPEAPLASLNSLDDENIGFVLLKPHTNFNDYPTKIKINAEETELLEVQEDDRVDIWVMLTLCLSDITKSTANLRAPVIINPRTQKGLQLILENEGFSYRQPLFDSARNPQTDREENLREGGTADACSIQEG